MEFKLNEKKLSKDGKYVLKTGLIFREGDYQDKKFQMSPEEIIQAEAEFSPVPIDVEHVTNLGVLKNKLGTLEAVMASDNGEELYGTAKIPVWLDELLGDQPVKVSCTWSRKDKKLAGLAIVENPRVSDAALFAAFTNDAIKNNPENTAEAVKEFFSWIVENNVDFKEQTWHGKDALQSIHDMSARSGAICSKPKDKAAKMAVEDRNEEFVAKQEHNMLQKIHDMTTSSGAKCHFMDTHQNSYYSDKEESTIMSETLNKIINFFKGLDADVKTEGEKAVASTEVESVNNSADEIQALKDEINRVKEQLAQKTAGVEVTSASKPEVEESEVEETEAELLKKELQAYKEEALAREAKSFSESLTKDGRILPAAVEVAEALFKQAVKDDAANAADSVKFGEGEELSSRVEVLKAFFNSIPANTQLTTDKFGILNFNKSGNNVEAEAEEAAKKFAEERNAQLRKRANTK